MSCTKTGAHIFLWQYGIYAYCDAFEIAGNWDDTKGSGDVAYFRIVATSYDGPIDGLDNLHYIVREIENWWKDDPVSTLITKAAGFENLGYEGQSIAQLIKDQALPPHQ